MVPFALPSPQPKRHLDWFSRFCTAHGSKSLLALKIALCMGISMDPHLIQARNTQGGSVVVSAITMTSTFVETMVSLDTIVSRTSGEEALKVAHGQMAGWIKMTLGREVCLGPSNSVLDGDPAPHPKKGDRAPNFRPMSVVANNRYEEVRRRCR